MIATLIRSAVTAAFVLGSAWPAGAQEKPAPQPPAAKSAPAQPGEPAAQPALCPVTGKPIDPAVFTRFRGKRVYFASKDCIDAFRADPGAYAAALKEQWQQMRPPRVQVTCPVTGKPVDKRYFVETPEVDIYFASAEAQAAWEKDKEPYEKKLDGCYTFQTGCGTCGGDIVPQAFVDFEGRRIYFCCLGCAREFQQEPQEYTQKLNEQIEANAAAWKAQQAAKAKAPDKPSDRTKP